MQMGDYVNIQAVVWPPFKGYGYDHGRHTAQLVTHLAQLNTESGGFGVMSEKDVRILSAAALLHDVGRTSEGEDPDHYRRGAYLADAVLSSSGNVWSAEDKHEVCRLILKHGDREAARGDKRLQVLQDADRMEAARFHDMRKLTERCKRELFWSPWAQDAGTLRTWLKFSKFQTKG